MPQVASFECLRRHHVSGKMPQTVCPLCSGPLFVRYDNDVLRRTVHREEIARHAAAATASVGMWRYAGMLPTGTPDRPVEPVSLGEGWTPMLRSRRYPGLYIKEEGNNPTGSCHARGLSLAVTMAKHYGLKHLAIASSGNAAAALASYAAAAGIQAHLYVPKGAAFASSLESTAYGADLHLVDGLVSDCERFLAEKIRSQKAAAIPADEVWFDVSTLKEPFRLEGEKTMGYELVEQFGWTYPEAVFYPTGGSTGLVGIWKAFEEIEALGWVDPESRRPRMYAVQAAGCASATRTSGCSMILDIVRKSGGRVVEHQGDDEFNGRKMLAPRLHYAKHEGVLLSPQGASAAAAYEQLLASGELKPTDRTVVFNTVAGVKYVGTGAEPVRNLRPNQRAIPLPTSLPVGGIITPQ